MFFLDLLNQHFISVSFDGGKNDKSFAAVVLLHFSHSSNRLVATNYLPSPFRMWEWAGARALLIVYPLGLMKRCSADFTHSSSLLCSWKHVGKKKSAEFSASVTEADAIPDNKSVFN